MLIFQKKAEVSKWWSSSKAIRERSDQPTSTSYFVFLRYAYDEKVFLKIKENPVVTVSLNSTAGILVVVYFSERGPYMPRGTSSGYYCCEGVPPYGLPRVRIAEPSYRGYIIGLSM